MAKKQIKTTNQAALPNMARKYFRLNWHK